MSDTSTTIPATATDKPQPRTGDDHAMQALSDAGAQCGDCGDQPGDRTCPDCEQHYRWCVDALRAAGWGPLAQAVADRDQQIIAWLGKKAREYRASGGTATHRRQGEIQAEAVGRMADKIQRGAVRAPHRTADTLAPARGMTAERETAIRAMAAATPSPAPGTFAAAITDLLTELDGTRTSEQATMDYANALRTALRAARIGAAQVCPHCSSEQTNCGSCGSDLEP